MYIPSISPLLANVYGMVLPSLALLCVLHLFMDGHIINRDEKVQLGAPHAIIYGTSQRTNIVKLCNETELSFFGWDLIIENPFYIFCIRLVVLIHGIVTNQAPSHIQKQKSKFDSSL